MVRDSEFCEAEYIQTPQGGVLKVFKHTTTSRIGAGPGKEGLIDSQYNTLIPIKYSKIYIYDNLAVLRSRDSSKLFYLPTKDFIYSLDNWMNALMTYGDAKDISRYKNPIFYLVSEDISDDATFTTFVADTINGKMLVGV